MKTTILRFLFIAFICTPLLQAQTLTKIAQIDGGAVRSMCSNTFGDLYCAALNQVYRSIDQGQSWQKQTSPVDSVVNLQLAAANDENSLTGLFAFAGGRVWKSTDEGQRWSTAVGLEPFLGSGNVQGIYSTRYGLLLASVRMGSASMILRSRNNGTSFDTLCTVPEEIEEAYQAQDSTIYLIGGHGYRVANGSAINLGLTRIVTSYQEFFNAPLYLWGIENNSPMRSSNKGSEWKSMKYNWNDAGPELFAILADREGNVFAFTRSTDSTWVYRLNNGTTSWIKVRGFGRVVRNVLLNINASFVASTDDGVYMSEDQGVTWSRTSRGISTYPLSSAISFENVVCVGGFDGALSHTNTGGLSWSTSNVPSSGNIRISELIVTSRGKIVAATTKGLWVSSDLGLNYFAGMFRGSPLPGVTSVAEVASGVLYSTTGNGLYRSSDDGLTWDSVLQDNFDGAWLAPSSSGRFVISTSRGLYAADTATNPALVNAQVNMGRCAVNASGTVYVAGYTNSIPGSYPVALHRINKQNTVETIEIPSTRTTSFVPVCVATGGDGAAFVNTDAGLFRVDPSESIARKMDLTNDVFTYMRNTTKGIIIAATAYGGVYIIDVTTGVNEDLSAAGSLRLAPQPASDILTLQATSPMSNIRVYDSMGSLQYDMTPASSAVHQAINTSGWAAGLYVVEVRENISGATTRRVFIVNH